MGIKQINAKNQAYYFYNIIELFKLIKNRQKSHIRISVFTILYIFQLKKLVIVKIFTV